MTRWILDANVLIYALIGHEEFGPRVRAALQEAQQRDITLFLPVAVVAEVLYVLTGKHFRYTRQEAADALLHVVLAEGIECQDQPAVVYALKRYRDTSLDFVDLYCAALAKDRNAQLLTNDQDIATKTGAPVRFI